MGPNLIREPRYSARCLPRRKKGVAGSRSFERSEGAPSRVAQSTRPPSVKLIDNLRCPRTPELESLAILLGVDDRDKNEHKKAAWWGMLDALQFFTALSAQEEYDEPIFNSTQNRIVYASKCFFPGLKAEQHEQCDTSSVDQIVRLRAFLIKSSVMNNSFSEVKSYQQEQGCESRWRSPLTDLVNRLLGGR